MTSAWLCEHGRDNTKEPPCPDCCVAVEDAEPTMTEKEWRHLWDTFVEEPLWDQLDPESQLVFKRAWYSRALPLFATIVRAVGEFDLAQKALRN